MDWKGNWILVLLVLAWAVQVQAGTLFFDDFADGNDAGWTRFEPLAPFGAGGTYSFPVGAYRIQAPPSPNPAALGVGRVGSFRTDVNLSSFVISLDILNWNNSVETGIGVGARGSDFGLGTTDGYYAHVNLGGPTDEIVIDRVTNEVASFPAVALMPVNVPAPEDIDLRLVFSGNGPLLTLELYDLSNLVSPLASVSGVDATYASGSVGILTTGLVGMGGDFDNNPLDATLDNFTAVPEPATSLLLLAGMAALLGVRPFGRRKGAR